MGLALELDEGGAAGVLGVDGIHHRFGAPGRDDIVIRAVVGPDLGLDVPGLFRIADRPIENGILGTFGEKPWKEWKNLLLCSWIFG